jgi:hypothetical protein
MSHHVFRAKRDPVVVLHDEVVAAEGGIKDAAKAIGRSQGVLNNKFSEAIPHYEITVREGIALAEWLGTHGFIESMCEQFDGVFLPLPAANVGDEDVLQTYLDIIHKMGELSREFTEARQDGVIEVGEYAALELKGHRTVAAIMRLLAELKMMIREMPKQAVPLSVAGRG